MPGLGQVGHFGGLVLAAFSPTSPWEMLVKMAARGQKDTNGSRHTHKERPRIHSPSLTMEDVYFLLLLEGQISWSVRHRDMKDDARAQLQLGAVT